MTDFTNETDDQTVSFDRLTDYDAPAPTLIEGLPGHGLVAAIAVDLLTTQLNLEHHGNVVSDQFPPVTSFADGRVRDLVRVYAGVDPAVMTLQSDLALPRQSFDALSRCVLETLAPEFSRAIFLAGSPAADENEVGEVSGIATSDDVRSSLVDAGIELETGPGFVGGVTGALANACYHADVPAAVLVVKANPYLPDPEAAASVIEIALEPLVDFDVDTAELHEQADVIRSQLEQIASQYRRVTRDQQPRERSDVGMYQ